MIDKLVLLSGGMDSTTLLWFALSKGGKVAAISFDYGQRHRRELDSARQVARVGGVADHFIVDLSDLGRLLAGSALTDPTIDPPHGHYAEETMAVTVVPNRNTILLSTAVGVAIGQSYEKVWAGMHAGDHPVYPDCRPEFVDKLNQLIPVATETAVTVDAPFIYMTKAQIATLGDQLAVPWHLTWSCYEGGTVHCGRCSTCVERREAFHLADVADPTDYTDPTFWQTAVAAYSP